MRRRTCIAISIPLLATLLLIAPASAEAQTHWGNQVLRPNAPQAGLFGPGSPRDSRGAPTVDFTLPVIVPGQYRIDLFSADSSLCDPVVVLTAGRQELDRDDDGGQGRNARLRRHLEAGTYTVRATCYGSSPITGTVPIALSVQGERLAPQAVAPPQRVGIGVPTPGVFQPRLQQDDRGVPYQDYTLNVPMAGTYQIDLGTNQPHLYDPALVLLRNGHPIAFDNSGYATRNARIVRRLMPGSYTVRVTRNQPGAVAGRATFTLFAQATTSSHRQASYSQYRQQRPQRRRAPQGRHVMRPDVPVQGVYGDGYVDYTFMIGRPGQFRFDLMSTDTHGFDPYLYLYQNGREIARDDDGGSGLNSRIVRTLHPGTYVVRVSRFGQGCSSPGQAGSCRPVPFSLSAVRER